MIPYSEKLPYYVVYSIIFPVLKWHRFLLKHALHICWRVEGALYHTLEQKISHYVFIEVHKQSQFAYQVDTVNDSSLTPNVVLLVSPMAPHTP